jgi:glycosyltransferase involved in cell wall biosynthesis
MNSACRLNSGSEAESRPAPRLLSIVIPFYNEEAAVPHLRKRLTELLPTLPCPAELILVNDGSQDGTLRSLQDWAACQSNIALLSLSRNFGHQAASTAGLDCVHGDAAVLMDADLQDPPEVILQMIAEYQRGYDVVYAQREARLGETLAKRAAAWLYYRLMRLSGCRNLPPDTGDFRLISASCLQALRSMRETHRFIRGMVAWVGFPQTAVRFKRPPRVAGKTKYSPGRMLWLAWTGALSFSPMPLRVVFGLGIIASYRHRHLRSLQPAFAPLRGSWLDFHHVYSVPCRKLQFDRHRNGGRVCCQSIRGSQGEASVYHRSDQKQKSEDARRG